MLDAYFFPYFYPSYQNTQNTNVIVCYWVGGVPIGILFKHRPAGKTII